MRKTICYSLGVGGIEVVLEIWFLCDQGGWGVRIFGEGVGTTLSIASTKQRDFLWWSFHKFVIVEQSRMRKNRSTKPSILWYADSGCTFVLKYENMFLNVISVSGGNVDIQSTIVVWTSDRVEGVICDW